MDPGLRDPGPRVPGLRDPGPRVPGLRDPGPGAQGGLRDPGPGTQGGPGNPGGAGALDPTSLNWKFLISIICPSPWCSDILYQIIILFYFSCFDSGDF